MKKLIKTISITTVFSILSLLILIAAVTVFETHRVKALTTKAASIQIGASSQYVISRLGIPRITFPKGSYSLFGTTEPHHAELVYGPIFDLKNAFFTKPPYVFPFRLRLFGPENGDLVITIDDNDRVLGIRTEKYDS
jgi:hypothetical protein